MKATKLFAGLCCILVSSALFAQEQAVKSQRKSETTVEDEYMASAEDTIIGELASSDDYDNKLVALSYLKDAVEGGRTSPEVIASLSRLAGEGVKTTARTNGRVMNNFPDVRAQACDLLGEVATEESKNTLVSIAVEDKEPMVVTAAIRSLGNIGINDNDEVINMIEFVHKRYAALNPTSSLALEVLNAYEKLAPQVQDKGPMIQSISEIRTNYRYATPVRTRATELLKSLQGSSNKKKNNTNEAK
ncbi:MAG: HEAT repeat domain-containing protein [Spirochaetia bacterium]|uniref:HEAT repeat domain-containing protein n=1 Tax=Treponema sp. TaxID=166 RepID=UPI00298DC1A5|nr:HEAT repeat domain-containing protein [Treponema sp.]MCI7397028.1 HEAT repeat domain-containing protein [Spirochaetia bacterium]MCI7578395.1 HEAT repeat domain-containing protein [Spirochaetia bacterium]